MKRNSAAEKAATAAGTSWEYMFLNPNGKDMGELVQWVADGKVQTVIDGVWPLAEATEAAKKNFSGRAKGKCVVEVIADATA